MTDTEINMYEEKPTIVCIIIKCERLTSGKAKDKGKCDENYTTLAHTLVCLSVWKKIYAVETWRKQLTMIQNNTLYDIKCAMIMNDTHTDRQYSPLRPPSLRMARAYVLGAVWQLQTITVTVKMARKKQMNRTKNAHSSIDNMLLFHSKIKMKTTSIEVIQEFTEDNTFVYNCASCRFYLQISGSGAWNHTQQWYR